MLGILLDFPLLATTGTGSASGSSFPSGGVKSAGSCGCQLFNAASIACAVELNSVLKTAIFVGEELDEMAWSREDLREERPESRWMMGQRVVDMPSRVSMLLSGEVGVAPMGEKGSRPPGEGVVLIGEVLFDKAVITS